MVDWTGFVSANIFVSNTDTKGKQKVRTSGSPLLAQFVLDDM
jgi:hypothetical protein